VRQLVNKNIDDGYS